MKLLTFADFQPYLHQVFAIRLEDGTFYQLELAELRELGDAPGPGFRRPFSLLFTNPDAKVYLPQRTYHLEHARMGSLDLFIVPLGPDANGMRYEVIFS